MTKSEHALFIGLVVICTIICFVGVHLAIASSDPTTAGRGGAIAVALSFGALFISRNYGHSFQKLLTQSLPKLKEELDKVMPLKQDPPAEDNTDEEVKRLKVRVQSLETAVNGLKSFENAISRRLNADAKGYKCQNVYLAMSSIVGTMFWGFGDVFAGWFI